MPMVMGLQDEEVGKEVVGWEEIGPCDICKLKRARWFCAADDAYLCHACDTSVHSANSVACRHERVRLTHPRITSLGLIADVQSSWPTKRIRSKRLKKSCSQNHGEFGPNTDLNVQLFLDSEAEIFQFHGEGNCLEFLYENDDTGFNDSQGSGSVDGMEETFSWEIFDRVKVEETDCEGKRVGVSEELFDLNIDLSDFAVNTQDEDVKVNECNLEGEEMKLCLMLNYEDVLSAWSDRGSPWAHNSTLQDEMVSEETAGKLYGVVPDLNMGNEGHSDQAEGVPVMNSCYYNDEKKNGCREGREARVIRYREKRQSRLFSKRIRYQVRKLNAEKRPRMKGRFVKSARE